MLLVPMQISSVRGDENKSWDCETSESKIIYFNETAVLPSPINYPGNVTIDGTIQITQDISKDNFFVRMEVYRLEPRKMKIPCIEGKGSCKYDVCNEMLPNNKEQFCQFGFCECPVKKGVYRGNGITYQLPKLGGDIFKKLLKGKYTVKVTFYNSQSETIYGSMCMNFTIVTSDSLSRVATINLGN